jgi:hypothetical protein
MAIDGQESKMARGQAHRRGFGDGDDGVALGELL